MRLLALALAALGIGLGASIPSAQERLAGPLTIYAATSLTDVFEAARDAFLAAHPDIELRFNFASSATLAAQIIAGAPADVFASANNLQMAKVINSGRVDAAAVDIFAHNRLTVVVPADNPAAIQSVPDLANDGVLLVLAAPEIPIRAYTDDMLASYQAAFGEGFRQRVLRNLVSEEGNVRQVLARVALGEADAGVVYQSDALGDVAARLHSIPIEERHNQLASYPIAPLKDGEAPALGSAFIGFILSAEAQPILAHYGFCWPAILHDVKAKEARPAPTLMPIAEAETPQIDCDAATIESG